MTNSKKMDQSYLFAVIAIATILVVFLLVILIKQNRGEDFPTRHRRRPVPKKKGMAIGMALGLGIGMSLGVSLDNIAIGMGVGVALGLSIGLALETAFKKREENSYSTSRNDHYESSASKKVLIAGLIAVLFGILFLGILLFSGAK